MSFPVIVREDAEDDILEAARWYEAREIGPELISFAALTLV